MFRRTTKPRREIRHAQKRLQRTHRLPHRNLDLDLNPLRKQMQKIINRDLAHVDSDEGLLMELDALVDAHVLDWLNKLKLRHQTRQFWLDQLDVELDGIVAALLVECDDERKKLFENGGVAFHVWDRVAEPDLPHIDPLR